MILFKYRPQARLTFIGHQDDIYDYYINNDSLVDNFRR